MPAYSLSFDSEAECDLDRLSRFLAGRIIDWLCECAADPKRHSHKPGFPHPPYPKFSTILEGEDGKYWVVALFQFSPDEATIRIRAIAVSRI